MEKHHNFVKVIKQHAQGCSCSYSGTFYLCECDDPNFEIPEPDHAIFYNHLVYLEILKNLNAVDLLACRRINSVLHLGANELLTKRNLLSLVFQYDLLQNNYFLTHSNPSSPNITNATNIIDLSTFTKTFAASPNFPCTSFQFLNGSLNSEPLQTFFTLQGYRINRLFVDVYCGDQQQETHSVGQEQDRSVIKTKYIPTLATLRNLLLRQAPNLISLSLQKCPPEWEIPYTEHCQRLFPLRSPRSSKFKVVLPKLKTLSYDTGKDDMVFVIVEDILGAAPYLKSVDSKVDTPMLYADKFHLMKFFEFYPSPDFIELYQSHLTTIKSSQLKRLHIALFPLIATPQHQEAARLVLSSVLNASTSTLAYVKFSAPLGLLGDPDFVVPKCPAVTSIKITTNKIAPYMAEHYEIPTNRDPATVKYFPQGFQLQDTFPSLSHVTFRFKHVPICSKWDSFFYHLQPVPTVKSLTILKSGIMPANTIAHCSRIFKNVVFLSVQVEKLNFYEASLNGLWVFKKLQEFSCDIHLAAYCGNEFPYLDAAFTGFSLETARRFRNALSLSENDLDNLDGWRETPSILMLQELRKLNMRFIDPSLGLQEFYATVFTQATCVGAFFKLPKLQVGVEIIAGFEENRIRIIRAILGILPAVQLLQA